MGACTAEGRSAWPRGKSCLMCPAIALLWLYVWGRYRVHRSVVERLQSYRFPVGNRSDAKRKKAECIRHVLLVVVYYKKAHALGGGSDPRSSRLSVSHIMKVVKWHRLFPLCYITFPRSQRKRMHVWNTKVDAPRASRATLEKQDDNQALHK